MKPIARTVRAFAAALLLLLALTPGLVLAQSQELMEAIRHAMALNQAEKYGEAVPHLEKAVRLSEREFGPNRPETAALVNDLAELFGALGRGREAEPLYKRALGDREKAVGPEHLSVATSLNGLGMLYYDQGRYAEAEPLMKRALAIWEKVLGPEHPNVTISISNLAALYGAQGRYSESEPLYKRAIAINEKTLGREHPTVATVLNNLAALYHLQGRYSDAEPLMKRALAIRERALGPEHPDVATSLNNIAELYSAQGRYAESEPLRRHVLAILEKALGPENQLIARSADNLAVLYKSLGRYAEAEQLMKRALGILEKSLSAEHPTVATGFNNLADLHRDIGRYAEAEPLYKRALAIRERALGPEHPDVATSLNGLARLYQLQGRFLEAESLFMRSQTVWEKVLGPEHPNAAAILNNLAALYQNQARYSEAEPLYEHSLAIWKKFLGPEHPDLAMGLNNLAHLYDLQGRRTEAEPLYKRALAIVEKAFGPEHPDVATTLNNLAALNLAKGRYRESEPMFKRALKIREIALGREHPAVAGSLNYLSEAYHAQGRYGDALGIMRRASAIHRARANRLGLAVSAGAQTEQRSNRFLFLRHVDAALNIARVEPSQRAVLTAEAFEAGQLAVVTSTAAAVARLGARFAAGDDRLARLVRERQDAVEVWQALDKDIVSAASRPPNMRDAITEAHLRDRIVETEGRISDLDRILVNEFPEYAELATPRPIPLAEVQDLLAPDEALIALVPGDRRTFLWVARRERAAAHAIDIGEKELDDTVRALRAGLDSVGVRTVGDIPPFDATRAYELYAKLVAPAEPLLEGANHVLVVPDGALQSIPLSVLITKEPRAPIIDFAGYRDAPWLARRYALTTLPSVSSLKTLRQFPKVSKNREPFVGIGDPSLDGTSGTRRGLELVPLFKHPGLADVAAVRRLPALPETAAELLAIARSLGGGEESLYLRGRARERLLRAADLSRFQVVAFATHALVSGDLRGLAEPALVLTPPTAPSAEDDGLLTASEVAKLKLDADWVILSACNTAAADGTPGAEGLSGLAKAFFYAGSRALLVSHWRVVSDAAAELTTRAFAEIAADPEIGRAEALRRSMLAMMANTHKPHFAHPMFWAPFVVVGEGGRGR